MLRKTVGLLLVGCLLAQMGCAARAPSITTPEPDQLHPGDRVRVTLKDGTRAEGDIIEVTEDGFVLKMMYKQYDTRGTRIRSVEYRWEDVAQLQLRAQGKKGESLRTALVMSAAVVGFGFILLVAVKEGLAK